MREVNLKISGMSCGHCVRAVEGALAEVAGVKVESVKIGKARVTLEDQVPVGALVDAVADAGYDAEEDLS